MSDAKLPALLLCTVVSFALAGCGFQPRGQSLASGKLGSVYVQNSGAAIGDELQLYLDDAGVVRAPDAASADVIVHLSGERYDRRVLSVDANTGKAREFELEYRVNYSALTRAGGMLVENQVLTLTRDFVFDADALIGKSREESELREEMRRDAVLQILGRLDRAMGG